MKYNTIKGLEVWQFNEIMGDLKYYDDEVYDMDDMEEIFPGGPWGAIRSAFYGGRYGFQQDPFNPNDEYFTFNGYGNLVSIPDYCLQDYFNQFEAEILEYVNANEIELEGVDEVKEVVGSWAICNGLSLNVYGAHYGILEWLVVGWSNEDQTHELTIEYDKDDQSYIELNGVRYYLAECMRV